MLSTSRRSSTGNPWKWKINLENGQGKEMVEEWKQKLQLGYSNATGIAAFNIATGRPLQSGHTCELSMEIGDALKIKQMVDLPF